MPVLSVPASFMLILILLPMTYARNALYQEPVTLLMDTVRKTPNKDRVHYNLGNELKDLGLFDQAESEWERTVALNPGHTQALNQLGSLWFMRRNYEKAVWYYRSALQADGNNAEACYNLGMTFEAKGEGAQALNYYVRFLQLVPPDHSDLTRSVSLKVEVLKKNVHQR